MEESGSFCVRGMGDEGGGGGGELTSSLRGLGDCSRRMLRTVLLAARAGSHHFGEDHTGRSPAAVCRSLGRKLRTTTLVVDSLAEDSLGPGVHILGVGRIADRVGGSPGRQAVGRCSWEGTDCIGPT